MLWHAPVVQVEPREHSLRQPLLTQVYPPRQLSAVEQKLPAEPKPESPQSATSTAVPTFCTWQPCPEGQLLAESGLQELLHSRVDVPLSVYTH